MPLTQPNLPLPVLPIIELTDAQFHRIRALVREHTGIALSDAKRQLVYGRLSRRLRALKLGSFREYIELLERGVANELEEFTNAITTNLTSFFREPHHFEYLATDVLPQIVARDAGVRRARIWCCAASTGEEPYSIGMVLREAAAAAPRLRHQGARHRSGLRSAGDRCQRDLQRRAAHVGG